MAATDLWYKNAIVYCLDVETYMDADGNGIGDFEGLSRRLEYLAGLGVTCLWLQPFFPSPNRDNGYDVTDYYGIHPKHGTSGEFVEFKRAEPDGVLIGLGWRVRSSVIPCGVGVSPLSAGAS